MNTYFSCASELQCCTGKGDEFAVPTEPGPAGYHGTFTPCALCTKLVSLQQPSNKSCHTCMLKSCALPNGKRLLDLAVKLNWPALRKQPSAVTLDVSRQIGHHVVAAIFSEDTPSEHLRKRLCVDLSQSLWVTRSQIFRCCGSRMRLLFRGNEAL